MTNGNKIDNLSISTRKGRAVGPTEPLPIRWRGGNDDTRSRGGDSWRRWSISRLNGGNIRGGTPQPRLHGHGPPSGAKRRSYIGLSQRNGQIEIERIST
jgi:hypothetical protein